MKVDTQRNLSLRDIEWPDDPDPNEVAETEETEHNHLRGVGSKPGGACSKKVRETGHLSWPGFDIVVPATVLAEEG